jgi:hypothetical protein
VGPNSPAIEPLLTQARTLTRSQIVRLDLLERRSPDLLLAAWDHLPDRLAAEPERTWRFAARDAAWRAVREGAAARQIDMPVDDGYWAKSWAGSAGRLPIASCRRP